jgi:hypothetical protein
MTVVTSIAKMNPKLQNKGFPAIYLGPAEDHQGKTYISWIHKTKSSIESSLPIILPKLMGTSINGMNQKLLPNLQQLQQIFDKVKDAMPVDEDGNNIPKGTKVHCDDNLNYDNELSYVSVNPITSEEDFYDAS